MADDLSFDPADMLEIDDDPLADEALDRHDEREPAGRHVEALARIFLPAREHVAADERDGYAPVASAVRRLRHMVEGCAGSGMHGCGKLCLTAKLPYPSLMAP